MKPKKASNNLAKQLQNTQAIGDPGVNGQTEQAFEAWNLKIAEAGTIADETRRVEALKSAIQAARTMLSQMLWNQDTFVVHPWLFEVFTPVLQVVQAIKNVKHRNSLLYEVACLLVCTKRTEQALEILELVEPRKMHNTRNKAKVLLDVASWINSSQPEQSFEVWNLAISQAGAIADEHQRVRVLDLAIEAADAILSYVGRSQETLTVHPWLLEVFTPTIQTVEAIHNAEHRNALLYKLACLFDNAQQMDQAVAMLNRNSVVVPSLNQNSMVRSFYVSASDSNHWQDRLSSVLPGFEEEPLAAWARREGIPEAYRFVYLPSFDPGLIIRVWSTQTSDSNFYAIAKLGRERRLGEESWMLSEDSLLAFLETVQESQFWHSSIWNLLLGLDGAEWIFEGWREGQYHSLDAWSPDNGPAYRLGHAFFDLLPQDFETIEIY